MYWILRNITIGIGGVVPVVVDNILRIYIEIGGVEPLVVDKILRRYIYFGGVEPLVVDILIFFGVRSEVLWEKLLAIEEITD